MAKEQKRSSLHETNRYEDAAFPVGMYEVTREGIVPDGRGYLDLHWHEELQFTLVDRGTLNLQVNAVDYTLEEGQGIFINRNLLHVINELSRDGRYFSLNFPDKMLGFFPGSRMEQDDVIPYTGNYAFPAVVLRREVPWQREILEDLTQVFGLLAGREESREYQVAMKLTAMWHRLICHSKGQLVAPSKGEVRYQERIRKMLSFIHEHYEKEIHLEDIAAAANVSKGECCRCFQAMVRKSPNQYLLNYRISKSMELLRGTEASVAEIALRSGFQDASHYIQLFKKRTGQTPREYRQQKC